MVRNCVLAQLRDPHGKIPHIISEECRKGFQACMSAGVRDVMCCMASRCQEIAHSLSLWAQAEYMHQATSPHSIALRGSCALQCERGNIMPASAPRQQQL